jgi:anti-sigma factor RsiW
MTTTSASETSQSTGSCVSPDDLKQYLSGWCDDSDAERIESHLTACPACEQALREFEVKPDTLLQMLQTTTVEKAPADDHAISHTADEPIDAALAIARKLMDVPIESARSAWQPASKELGVYELLRPLGRGGMGAVYLAKHRQLHKQVAIKLLPVMSAEDSDVRARFQREIRVVGKLNHPSIVAATDAGEIDGTQFLVMEYVPGMDLSRLARLLGKLTVSDASELMRQVALWVCRVLMRKALCIAM